jgi:hypothetical protein
VLVLFKTFNLSTNFLEYVSTVDRFPTGVSNLLLHRCVQKVAEPTQALVPRVPSVLAPGIKRPKREADYSLTSMLSRFKICGALLLLLT